MSKAITLNLRADEYAKVQELAVRCSRSVDFNSFDDKMWIDGLAEILGAAIVCDLMLWCNKDNPAITVVAQTSADWKKPRLECEGEREFMSDIIGAGPKGKDAMTRYKSGGIREYR